MDRSLQATGRRTALALVLVAALASGACAGRKGSVQGADLPEGERYGVYRATAMDLDGDSRRFRLFLYAAPPDRIHAEVVPRVGGARLVVDGGGGLLAVTFPTDRVAYAGEAADVHSLEGIGLEVSLEGLVGMILEGRAPENGGPRFLRVPETGGGLPGSFEIDTASGSLHLELLRFRAIGGDGGRSLGTGRVDPGLEILPLEDLGDRHDASLLAGPEGEP